MLFRSVDDGPALVDFVEDGQKGRRGRREGGGEGRGGEEGNDGGREEERSVEVPGSKEGGEDSEGCVVGDPVKTT